MPESTVFIYINSFKSHISFNEINPLVNPILGKKKKRGEGKERLRNCPRSNSSAVKGRTRIGTRVPLHHRSVL